MSCQSHEQKPGAQSRPQAWARTSSRWARSSWPRALATHADSWATGARNGRRPTEGEADLPTPSAASHQHRRGSLLHQLQRHLGRPRPSQPALRVLMQTWHQGVWKPRAASPPAAAPPSSRRPRADHRQGPDDQRCHTVRSAPASGTSPHTYRCNGAGPWPTLTKLYNDRSSSSSSTPPTPSFNAETARTRSPWARASQR